MLANPLKAKRSYYDEHYRGCGIKRSPPSRVEIPANVEIREHSEPCFLCGAREGCRHRV